MPTQFAAGFFEQMLKQYYQANNTNQQKHTVINNEITGGDQNIGDKGKSFYYS